MDPFLSFKCNDIFTRKRLSYPTTPFLKDFKKEEVFISNVISQIQVNTDDSNTGDTNTQSNTDDTHYVLSRIANSHDRLAADQFTDVAGSDAALHWQPDQVEDVWQPDKEAVVPVKRKWKSGFFVLDNDGSALFSNKNNILLWNLWVHIMSNRWNIFNFLRSYTTLHYGGCMNKFLPKYAASHKQKCPLRNSENNGRAL